MVNRSEYIRILEKYLDGSISREEHDELFSVTSKENIDAVLSEMIDVELNRKSPGADLPPHISEEILRNILISEKHTAQVLSLSRSKWKYRVAAAVVFILILASAYFFWGNYKAVPVYSAGLHVPKTSVEQTNHTMLPYAVVLGDGSKVVLQPHATINYPAEFTSNSREVYLKGEAFFNVVKNPAKPFRVYYNDIVTQVLGTSFTVKTNPSTNNIEVTVKTGSVQVFENTTLLSPKGKVKGVIVTQNQKVTYYKDQRVFETTLSDSLQPIIAEEANDKSKTEPGQEDFYYSKPVSVQTIFNDLHRTYGIEIVVENENLYNCLFTGDLSKQDVYKKLEMICLAVDAQFDVKGTRILVSGKGCN